MEQGDKISVIIPVYKVEKFLRKCIDSVVSQTYTNLEIFLIDDGSPDNCGKICDEYPQQDKRIVVVHKKNGGLSSARNAALDQMTGEYVAFVDSDDWVEPTYLEDLYKAIKKYNCDMSVCFHSLFDENGNNLDRDIDGINCFVKKEECYPLFYIKKAVRETAWGKLYTRQMFDKTRYPEGKIFEDTYIWPELLANIEVGINIIDKPLYNYLALREGNITNSISKRSFEDKVGSLRHNCEVLDKESEYYPYVVDQLFGGYIHLYNTKIKKTKDKELINLYNLCFKQDYKKYKKYLKGRVKYKYMLIRYCRPLYCFLRWARNPFRKEASR